MKNIISYFIIFFNFLVFNLPAQNPPILVDMSNKIPIAGNQVNLTDIQVIGTNVWITSSNPANIFHSTDSGNSFTAPVTAFGTQAIFMFSDASNGWAVGSSYGYRTTDGGAVWSKTTIGGPLNGVNFPTASVGYAVGGFEVIYKTENGGTSWVLKPKPVNISATILSVNFPSSSDPNTGYIALSNAGSTVFKTTNGGDTWTTMTLAGITSSMNCLEFIDANTGWAAGGNGEIFSYKNGTWTKQTSPVTTTLNGISFAPDGLNGWAVGNGGVILHTTDGGITWTQEGIGLTTQNLTKVDVVSSTEAYIVGYGKTFIKYTNSITGVNEVMVKPASFILEQNYPNPFSQYTAIPYFLSVPGKVSLTVYTLSGQQVTTLVDEVKPAGSFTADFNGGRLLPGIYYYRLQHNNSYETRKMFLIK